MADEVRQRRRDAMQTLRRMCMPAASFPAGDGSAWPDVVQDFWEVYGQHGTHVTRIRPSPAAIQRMDLVLEWLYWVDDTQQRRDVMLRAIPLSWRKVGFLMGLTKASAVRPAGQAGWESCDRHQWRWWEGGQVE